ncbi:MAG: family 20 glycosylhydrolase [Bacteroidota bacterium]
MKKIFFSILLGFFSLNAFCQSDSLQLIPYPSHVKITSGKFLISDNFSLSIDGKLPGKRIHDYAFRFLQRLDKRCAQFFKYDTAKSDKAPLQIQCKEAGKTIPGTDESYKLIINPENIVLDAATDLGAMHGLETLLQLLTFDKYGYYFPCCEISDSPRFPWRGLMLDVCRHFMPVEVIKRNIDAMASVKMNVLHLHLSEDQGFRVECKTFPKLHEMGSNGDYFTQDQIREILKYAEARGIMVVPEFDIPGHSTSWFVGYPQYASAPGPYSVEKKFGVCDPTFNPTDEKVYLFFDSFFKEISALFPSPFMHIGGDENNGKQWDSSAVIQAFKKKNNLKNNHELQGYFNKRILKMLTKYGKRMIGWDEILQPGFPDNIVIQSWRGKDSMMSAAKKNYATILSNGYYIDLCESTQRHYMNDPLPAGNDLTEKEQKLILGGEATMWAELVTPENVDSRIWPRTAAIAERLWSSSSLKSMAFLMTRLEKYNLISEEFGLTQIKNQDMMLRKLTQESNNTDLHTMLEFVQPIQFYKRHQYRTYYQTDPLTRLVDISVPDPIPAFWFNYHVFHYSIDKDKKHLDFIGQEVQRLGNAVQVIQKNILIKPYLNEMDTLVTNLNSLCKITTEALGYLKKGKKPSAEWMAQSQANLIAARKPCEEMEIVIAGSVEILVNMLK